MAIGLGNLLKIGKTLTSGALDSDAFAEMLAQLGMEASFDEVALADRRGDPMTKEGALFPALRQCVCCGSSVPRRGKLAPGRPSIVALNITIYRRTKTGRQLATTKESVRVCEACLGIILPSQGELSAKASLLAKGIVYHAHAAGIEQAGRAGRRVRGSRAAIVK